MGDTGHLHHLHTFFLEKLEGHRDVEAHANMGGRYKVKIVPHDGKEHTEEEKTSLVDTSNKPPINVESEVVEEVGN